MDKINLNDKTLLVTGAAGFIGSNLVKRLLRDDRGKNGTSDFTGEWIEFGSEKFPDWNSVFVYLGVVK